MYLSKLDVIKFKSNLIGTAKLYRYSLSLLIPMLIADALINGLENTFFATCIIIGYIPVLIIKVLFLRILIIWLFGGYLKNLFGHFSVLSFLIRL